MKHIAHTVLRIVTAAYAIALVVATHTPRLAVSFDSGTPIPADKLLHFTAYGVLGMLVGFIAEQADRKLFRWLPMAFAAVACFALVDEITQPMFQRHAEPFDWVADIIGGGVGLCLTAGCIWALHLLSRMTTADH